MGTAKDKHLICIHGLGRTSWDMALLYSRLKKRLTEYEVHNFNYPTRAGGISTHSDRLFTFIQEQIPQGAQLNFACHSLGSIVTRATAPRVASTHTLGRAVFLGPPNQGAKIARVLSKFQIPRKIFGPTLTELGGPEIPLATDLLETGILAGRCGVSFGFLPLLGGDNDGLVLLSETFLDGAKSHKQLFLPHPLMPFSNRAARLVAGFIETGQFERTETLTTPRGKES